MMRRGLSLTNVVALVLGLAAALVVTATLTTKTLAHAESPQPATIFYAKPNASGTAYTIAGLLQGDPNTAHTYQEWATDQCSNDGSVIPGTSNITITTNASGYAYFTDTINAPASDFVYFSVDDIGTRGSNCYPTGADNTSWAQATAVPLNPGGTSAGGYLGVAGESRWFKVQIPQDANVTLTLSSPSSDFSIAAYSDISAADGDVSGGTDSLNKLNAEFASDAFSPSAFIPSAFIPSAFIPSAFIPSAFIPSAFIPSAFIPSAFIPSAFIPSSYSPSAFIPSAFIPSAFIPSAFVPSSYTPSAFIPSEFSSAGVFPQVFNTRSYDAAVNSSLITYNDDGGSSNKTITFHGWQANTASYYIRVAGANGAFNVDDPFTVTINDGNGACPATVLPSGTAPANQPGTGRQTVIVTDSAHISGTSAAVNDMKAQLQTLANRPEVNGVVVDLATNTRVQTLRAQAAANPTCPYAENLLANAIRDVVNSYRGNNPLKYVAIAGPDSAIPFFRHPDETLLGNETGYTPPVANTSPSQASLRLGYTLSDNDYGANTRLLSQTDTFPVPDLAVGRLVETASEISGQVSAYLGNAGGVLPTPSTGLVTGYDFLTLPANQVETDLTAGLGHSTDTLIAPRTQAPADGWTAADLKQKVLNSGRHDIVFLAGHFSGNDTLAADYTTDMITTDMEASSVDLKNSLVFSAGCHSGYNIDDHDAINGVTLGLDWPQEFARKQAILIGGTGYQYGDTDFVAYSEQIDATFAHALRYGTGPVSIGQALLTSKQTYLQDLPNPDSIEQKAVLEATLYGLPMASINLPTGRIPAPTDTSVVGSTSPVATNPGSTLGLRTTTVNVNPNLSAKSETVHDLTNDNAAVTATYYSADQGTLTRPYQPVLPLVSKNVSVAGQSLRGALFLGGAYADEGGVTPLTGAPATEIRGVHTGFSSPSFYPEKPWSINYYDSLDGADGGATRLMVTPAQHVSDPDGASTDTRRTYNSMQFQLYYDNNTTTYGTGSSAVTPATSAPPDIVKVQSFIDSDNNTLDVCASIGANPAVGVQRALATYTDPTASSPHWTSADLASGGCVADHDWNGIAATDSSSWGAQIPLTGLDPNSVQFMVQAVNGTGLVSMDDNVGKNFTGAPAGDRTEAFFSVLNFDNTTVSYGGGVFAVASLRSVYDPDARLANVPVTFTIGTQTIQTVTNGGGNAEAQFMITMPPGTYQVSVGVGADNGVLAEPLVSDSTVTVTKQATMLTLDAAAGSSTQTSYTATLCSTPNGPTDTCTDDDPPLPNQTIVFRLTGGASPVTKTVITNSSGQATWSAFGLTPGSYELTAYYLGDVPGVGTLSDPAYDPATPAVADFTTTAADTAAPVLTLPAPITVPVDSGGTGAVVSYAVKATDAVDPRPSVSCIPGSASFFPVGTTTVNCTATDTAGNFSNGSFTVKVTATPPQPVSVSVAGSQTFGSTPVFTYSAAAGVTGTVTCTKVSTGASINPTLPVGTYTIDPATCSGLSAPNGVTYTATAGDFTVAKAPTTLVMPASAEAGLLTRTFTATLKRTSDSAPIAGQTIVFAINGTTICTGTTNSAGLAKCTVFLVVISLTPVYYTAFYAGNANYLGSMGISRV